MPRRKQTAPPHTPTAVERSVDHEVPVSAESAAAAVDQVVLRAVLDTAVDAIVTIDAGGLVEVWNKAAERLFGYPASEVVGRNVSMIMPEPHASRHDFYLERYLTTGKTAIIGVGRELMGRRKDGSLFPMELSVAEFRVGHRRMFTGIVRDITDRRRLERLILEAATAEQRRIGQDLHDGLCQQLTAISFVTTALQKRLPDDPGAAKEKAGDIARLTQEAMAQARALARGLCPVPVDERGLAPALQLLAANASDQFKIACTARTDPRVRLPDPEVANHLYRIAQEATSNAVRHGKAHSVKIAVELDAAAGAVVLTVTDDGVGIANTMAPPKDSAPHAPAAGVGLNIMRHRAGLIGGVIDIRPGADRGTVVSCTVPVLLK